LRGLTIDCANQVWALDTTYIPMTKGFVYPVAVVDWASRKVLAAKVTIFSRFVTSTTAPIATGWSEKLPDGICTH